MATTRSRSVSREQSLLSRIEELERQNQESNAELEAQALHISAALAKHDRELSRVEEEKDDLHRQDSTALAQSKQKLSLVEKDRDHYLRRLQTLHGQLEDAKAKIFELQPYSEDLTANLLKNHYQDLVSEVESFIQRVMDPWFDDDNVDQWRKHIERAPQDEVKNLQAAIEKHSDLRDATSFPETEVDILLSIIMRFLREEVFLNDLSQCFPSRVKFMQYTEATLRTQVKPNRGCFSTRNWEAEAYQALLVSDSYAEYRSQRSKKLAEKLMRQLSVLILKGNKSQLFEQVRDHCIEPSTRLLEMILVSPHRVEFNLSTFPLSVERGNAFVSIEFLEALDLLDCKDILHNGKAFSLAKTGFKGDRKEVQARLMSYCAVAPSVSMTRIGHKGDSSEPLVVSKQTMLVGWSDEKSRDLAKCNTPNVLHFIRKYRIPQEKRVATGVSKGQGRKKTWGFGVPWLS